MDYKLRYFLFGCVLTFIEVWTVISSTSINFTKYHYDFNLAGYRCVPDKTAFETDNVFDPLQCGKLCHLDKKCRSVFYDPESKKCIGCRVNPEIPTGNHEACHGSKHFRSKPVYSQETDCKDILKNRRSAPSGIYQIRLWKSQKLATVYCDMHTDGGGWTVFQNRFIGSVDFNRNFSEYENGFGAISGEFWLGLKYIQELADQSDTEIRLELERKRGGDFYSTYKDFKLLHGSEYKLSLNASSIVSYPVVTNARNFAATKGYPFSTFDRDMDALETGNCAERKRGGWWYSGELAKAECTAVSLNGEYCTPENDCDDGYRQLKGLYHLGFAGESLKTSRMLIRRY